MSSNNDMPPQDPGYPQQPGYPGQSGYSGGQGAPQWGPQSFQHGSDQSINTKGIIPLRPLNLGDLFDGSFKAIRKNPKVMFGFSAIVLVILGLISLLSALFLPNSGLLMSVYSSSMLVGVISSVIASILPALLVSIGTLILSGMLVFAVSRAVIGEFVSVGQLWAGIKNRVGTLILWGLLVTAFGVLMAVAMVITPVFTFIAIAQNASTSAIGGLALLSLGLVVVILVVYLWLYMRLIFTSTVIVLEKLSVGAAMRRSWTLIRGFTWRTFGIMLLTYLIVAIVTAIISVPTSIPMGALMDESTLTAPIWTEVVFNLGTTIAAIVTIPFSAAMLSLVYIDTRMRKEGLDIQLQQSVQDG